MLSSKSESTGFWSAIMRRIRGGDGSASPVTVYKLEDVRRAMLSQLTTDSAQRHPILAHRIAEAKDAQALWYQRSSLMAALSEQYGEEQAHERMGSISSMFQGLLPKDMMPRPTRITRRRRRKK